jgi:predicted NBD/HSP70 family sugar kinase
MEIIDERLLVQVYPPEEMVRIISENVNAMLDQAPIDRPNVLGMGIGTVGPLDREEGIMISPVNFPSGDWFDVPLKEMMERETGLPVLIDNGANTAVLAEYLFGMGKGLDSIAYFNCGIGIRTGAINSGTVIRTRNNAEDVFGHMVVDVDGELCSCGSYGCIECYSSIPAIMRKYKAEVKKRRFSSFSKMLDEIGYADICAAAEENDELAREAIISAAAVFGAGLANYINLLNPKLVILSGPLIRHSQLFYDTCTRIASERCCLRGENSISFSKGGYFQDYAIAVGAAVVAVGKMLQN